MLIMLMATPILIDEIFNTFITHEFLLFGCEYDNVFRIWDMHELSYLMITLMMHMNGVREHPVLSSAMLKC